MAKSNSADRKPETKRSKKANVPIKQEPEEVFNPETSNLVAHAKRELSLAGIDNADSDYGGAIATAVTELVTTFASQRHSGCSAQITIEILNRLLRYETLTPLTDNPGEWQSVSQHFNEPMWQNIRSPKHFSRDGGKTYYDVETNKRGRSMTAKEFEDAKKKASQEKPEATK